MEKNQGCLRGLSAMLAVIMLIQLLVPGLTMAANTQSSNNSNSFTKVGNTIVYTHGYNVTAKELALRSWLFVTDANGILYKKVYNNSAETTDDVFFSLPPDCHLKFKPNSVYFNADGLLYLNTTEGNQLYSVIPNILWDFELYIQEQQLILDGAARIKATRVQATAKERIEAYCQAERGIFTETFRKQNNISYLARRENISQTPKPIVKDIQTWLSALGYSSSNVDGYYDWITWNNVAYFQMTNELDTTGHLDQPTYDLIKKKYAQIKQKQTALDTSNSKNQKQPQQDNSKSPINDKINDPVVAKIINEIVSSGEKLSSQVIVARAIRERLIREYEQEKATLDSNSFFYLSKVAYKNIEIGAVKGTSYTIEYVIKAFQDPQKAIQDTAQAIQIAYLFSPVSIANPQAYAKRLEIIDGFVSEMGDVWQEFQKLTPDRKVTVIEQAVGELGANVGIDYLTGKGATSLLSSLKNSVRNVMKNEAFMARLKSETGAINLGGAGKGLTGNNWRFDLSKDVDLRGSGKTYKDAFDEAFNRTGLSRNQFKVTKWGKDINGKSVPVEWEGPDGSSVNMDIPQWNNVKPNGALGEGPHQPHIGYQTPGKGANRTRGHIFVDDVPATRR